MTGVPIAERSALPLVEATRVVRRERSGSSSPIIVDSTDGQWFTKLRGAAQGIAPLVAEVIVAELAEALSLSVPSRGLVTLPRDVRSDDENDELRDLLHRSAGLNVGFSVLEAARNLTRAEYERVPLDVAASVLWLDMLVQNLDRTPSNPNIMVRRGTYWLIDHGAALPFHHDWQSLREDSARQPYDVHGHVFGWSAPVLSSAHESLSGRATRALFAHAVSVVPDELLAGPGIDVTRRRAAYGAWLWKRRQWMEERL